VIVVAAAASWVNQETATVACYVVVRAPACFLVAGSQQLVVQRASGVMIIYYPAHVHASVLPAATQDPVSGTLWYQQPVLAVASAAAGAVERLVGQ
jgi:hypothetical protein